LSRKPKRCDALLTFEGKAMAAAVGMLNKLGIDSANPVTKQFDFHSFSLRSISDQMDLNGLRGTLSHDVSRVRQAPQRISGTIEMTPNAVEWALLLPWILGTAGSGSPTVTFALSNSCLTRYIAGYFNVGNIFTWSVCAVNRATISASQGGPLRLVLDIVGETELISGSFPAISIDTANGPYVFTDSSGGLVTNAVTVTPKTFTIVIDNHLDTERFFNSLTLVSHVKHDRTITCHVDIPFGDFSALYNLGAGGINTVYTFTNGGAVLVFTMANVVYRQEGPPMPGRTEIMLPLSGRAYSAGATLECVVTQNPGP
jgi:hypothetical protein